jgi:hypothetical protein
MPGRAQTIRSAGVMAEATVPPASARMSRAVRMPTGRRSGSTTTRPVTPSRLASAAASATVRSGPTVYGRSITRPR